MLLLILVVALLQPLGAWAQTPALRIDTGAGMQNVEIESGRGNAVFLLSSLEPLGARLFTDAHGARLRIFDDTIVFETGSPFVRIGKRAFQLIAPVRRDNGSTLVAVQFLTEMLPQLYPNRFEYRNNTLKVAQTEAPTAQAAPAHAPALAQAPAHARTLPANAEARVVIIDAGHGGIDSGKVGPNGLAEKTVTLTVANKLAALLRDRGYEVHMTRTADTLIALADRPRFANQWKNGRPATLFISIHANAGDSRATGYETYFLSEARTEDERRVAEMENTPVAIEDRAAAKGPAIDQLLTGLRNDYYQRASNDFAEVIQRELAAFHPGPSRGVKQAGFRVLVGAVMPAVLVEIAFISNPGEAHLLGTAAFQDKIAYSLSRSIANFFDSHQRLWQDAPVSQ